MPNEETQRLLQQLIDAQRQCFDVAATLSNADLDRLVPMGSREIPARAVMYQLVVHPREHYVHLQKVLQETGAPGARPTEAQLIADQAAQALGTFIGLFARMSDDDLDREFEGHSPRTVLEHLIQTYGRYYRALSAAIAKE